MQKPQAEPGEKCPFLDKDVSKVCHKCPLYVQLRGTNPNTGAEVDTWGCAFALTPMLLVENSQQSRQTGASVDNLRNELVKGQDKLGAALVHAAKLTAKRDDPKLIEG